MKLNANVMALAVGGVIARVTTTLYRSVPGGAR